MQVSTEPNVEPSSLSNPSGQKLKNQETLVSEAALSAFGFAGGSLVQLQQLVNTSFQAQHESGDWYLRVYNPHRRNAIEVESELAWMEALSATGFAVPTPHRTIDNRLLWQFPTDSSAAVHFACVTSWLEGEIVSGHERGGSHYAAVGRMLAEVHEQAVNWKEPQGFSRPNCDAEGVYSKLDELILHKPKALESQLKIELEEARDALLKAESIIGREFGRYGLIHGDPSFGNILFKDESPRLIDFDDCGYGFFVSDLAVVLAGAWGKAGYAENREALLNGYQQVRSLVEAELDALPLMMAARAASLILWAAETSRHSWIEGQWHRLREYIANA